MLNAKQADQLIAEATVNTTSSVLVDSPIVSVILNTYNHGKFVEEALKSILEQDVDFLFEIIIGDDASRDGTFEIIQRYHSECPEKIKILLSTENLGKHTGNGRLNAVRSLQACRGKYIAILEGDDYWTDPQKLQKQVDMLEANPGYAFCFHTIQWLDQETGTLTSTGYGAPGAHNEYRLNDLLEYSNFVPTPSVLLRAELIGSLPEGYMQCPIGDWPLLILSLQRNSSEVFGCIQEEMAVYRRHAKGMHGGQTAVQNLSRLIKAYRVVGHHFGLSGRSSWRMGYAKWNADLAVALRQSGQTMKAYSPGLMAFLVAPRGHKKTLLKKALPNLHRQLARVKGLTRRRPKEPESIEQRTVREFKKRPNKKNPENHFLSAIESARRFSDEASGGEVGQFKYALKFEKPVLYGSVYAAMLQHLTGDLESLDESQKQEWCDYINSFQCEDGLYRDPCMQCDLAENEDWWGWRHLTAHLVSALTFLGGKPRFHFSCLKPLYGQGATTQWLESLPWDEKPDYASNTVMNYGVLLQYECDFMGLSEAKDAMNEIYRYLEETVNPVNGLWGMKGKIDDPKALSVGVQTSYHLWNLYYYDRREIPYLEPAIDHCLATQNCLGGFGVELNSSACDDIDTIDPLARFTMMTSYRKDDIQACLRRALPWVLFNQMPDGGFVFKRYNPFAYGHDLMTTDPEESHMFATWFRTLSLAYLTQALPELKQFEDRFHWQRCPGYQFWP